MEETGKVIKTNKNQATVLIELPPGCDSCEFSKFCSIEKNAREIVCINNRGAKKGDVVLIGTKNKNFYIAIIFNFILPLFLLISGVFVGKTIWQTDLYGFFTGIITLILYFSVYFFLDKIFYKKGSLLPEILSIKEKGL